MFRGVTGESVRCILPLGIAAHRPLVDSKIVIQNSRTGDSESQWLGFTGTEWARLSAFYATVAILHALGWGLYLYNSARYPSLLGLGFAAYMLGLRHAFDADHIAAVDNTVRLLLQKRAKPLGTGFFFALGHSTVVLAMTVATVVAAARITERLPGWQYVGGIVGAGVSGAFLWLVGILNMLVLLRIVRVWRQQHLHAAHDPAQLEDLLAQRGFANRFLGNRLQRGINSSWQMFPLGFLFGLGFDTASEIALLGMAAGATATALPVPAILSLPLLFAAGMSAMDTTDGVLMTKAYSWAFVNPLRKIFYNVMITGGSVVVALVIGTFELLQVSVATLHLTGTFYSWVARMDLGVVGGGIVGAFILTWCVSAVVWRFGPTARHFAATQWQTNEHV